MTAFSSKDYLRFGIPSLDELICGSNKATGVSIRADNTAAFSQNAGVEPPASPTGTTSVCMIGPDGTGKSVLAMHIVAHYAADMYTPDQVPPKIFYVSTDLKYDKAVRVWNNFCLHSPYKRKIRSQAFPKQTDFDQRYSDCFDLQINMLHCAPLRALGGENQHLAQYICASKKQPNRVEVAFVNLASDTAGDDWSYLNRVLALLDEPQKDQPRHLLVLDAVEGLETLVGTYDVFGEERTRRSRVAQLMRTAAEKCHVVLVIEEPKDNERLPEEFVTDVVIRLRSIQVATEANTYVRRTVEVDKARAQKHIRGQHNFVIRTGEGSTTLARNNPDDPVTQLGVDPAEMQPYTNYTNNQFGYVEVFHSLHYLHRAIMEQYPGEAEKVKAEIGESTLQAERGELDPAGVQHIAPSAAKGTVKKVTPQGQKASKVIQISTSPVHPNDDITSQKAGYAGFGLPHLDNLLGGMTSVDDEAIFKTQIDEWSDLRGLPYGSVTVLIGETGTHKNRLATAFLSQCFAEKDRGQVAVLLTTYDMNDKKLIEKFSKHLGPERAEEAEKEKWRERIVCRRLEKHDLSSATLYHIILSAVREAKLLLGKAYTTSYPQRQHDGRNIRLVISNLDAMRSTYPDVEHDPLFLPALFYHLRREGVTSLLLQMEEGGPNNEHRRSFTRTLVGEADHHLFTWHVPFYGEDRIAIAAIPPVLDDHPAVIRELRSVELADGKKCADRLEVDPGFEIYTGLLEKERPKLVPLQIRLWGGAEAYQSYISHLNGLFQEHFAPLAYQQPVVIGVPKQEYDDLMSFSFLQGNSNLDHTVVMQVDEFWSGARNGLLRIEGYLAAHTVRKNKLPDKLNDPFSMFQCTKADIEEVGPKARYTFFETKGFKYKEARNRGLAVNRVPYSWDFGFLLLRKAAWDSARERSFADYSKNDKGESTPPIPISDIFQRLTNPQPGEELSWRHFLQACSVVARVDANEAEIPPHSFDVDMLAPETFSCFILEMWASEIYKSQEKDKYVFKKNRHDDSHGHGLIYLLQHHRKELYRIWFLVGEMFSAQRFGEDWTSFQARPVASGAVAARHWYSSACQTQSLQTSENPFLPVRLPGHYSVRGDWYLALVKGSRSPRLAQHAMDILSSRRMNVTRLQEGIGLPTRFFTHRDDMGKVWTRLFKVLEYGKKEPLTYDEVIRLGVIGPETENPIGCKKGSREEKSEFFWLWRYTLADYDRHSRLFLKLLRRLLSNWNKYLAADNSLKNIRNGFEAYDRFDELFVPKAPISYEKFSAECDVWIGCLESATPYGKDINLP